MSPEYDFDLITIGAGSGGVRASRMAASHGARVAIVEEDRAGGTCVLRGCVPKKLLVYGSSFAVSMEDSLGFGWAKNSAKHDWTALMTSKRQELDRLAGIYIKLLNDAGVEMLSGRGSITSPHSVRVEGKEYTAERILIAVGSWPQMLPIEGLKEHSITSNEALDLAECPQEIVIYGAGFIAVEFAGIFNSFGAKVHLVYRGDLPLRGFDDDIREQFVEAVAARGVILHPQKEIKSVTGDAKQKTIILSDGTTIIADQVMVATGRKPLTEGLGLEECGIELGRGGAIKVDADNRTNVESIFALGDVTNRITLTPVAIAEGQIFADKFYGGANDQQMDYANVPTAVFCQPPLAQVGLTEAEARQNGVNLQVFTSAFKPMKNTLTGGEEQVFMKLLVDADTDKVIGVHMLGDDAAEIMQGIGIAIKAGARKADFDRTIGIHPTTAEEFTTMK